MEKSLLLIAGSVALGATFAASGGATFQVISPGGASAVSSDGSTVVGASGSTAFKWTSSGGTVPIGLAAAVASSGDGSVIGGTVSNGGIQTAARWDGSMWNLLGGLFPTGCDSSLSTTYAISDDGSIVVGLGWEGCDGRAFRWTQADGMIALPQNGPNSARASAISGDGMFIGGFDEAPNGMRRASVWNAAYEETILLEGEPGNEEGAGEVSGFNPDGSIIVGHGISATPATNGPFVWRKGKGITYLGNVPGTAPVSSGAQDTSADGSVIVGFQREGFGGFAVFDATIWTEATGTIKLRTYLEDLGVTVPPTLQLASCLGISDDGTVICGWGYTNFILNQSAWVATIPSLAKPCVADINGDGVVDGKDLAVVLGSWNPDGCIACEGDLNDDGVIDGEDLSIVLGAWGDCP